MKLETPRSVAALFVLSALLFSSAPLAATPAGGTEGPPLEMSTTDVGGDEAPAEETDLGPAADPDGLSSGSPTPGSGGGASSFLSWLRSLLGSVLRGI